MGRSRLVSVLVSVVLAVGGCAASDRAPGTVAVTVMATGAAENPVSGPVAAGPATADLRPVTAAAPTVSVAWTFDDRRPLGQPYAVDDTAVVVYVVDDEDKPSIQVMDAATGAVRWRHAVSVGIQPAGVGMSSGVVSGRVAYLEPVFGSRSSGRVTLADAITGEPVAQSTEQYWVSAFPEDCDGLVCFTAQQDGTFVAMVMDPTTGAVSPAPTSEWRPENSRDIGPAGLISIHPADQPERVGRVVDGRLLWEHPTTEVFGGNASDAGHVVGYDDATGLFIGSLGYDSGDDSEYRLDIADRMSGVDAATGENRWTEVGVDNFCAVYLQPMVDRSIFGIRCRWQPGTVMSEGVEPTVSGGVSIEGFDPRTGRTLWSTPSFDVTGQTRYGWYEVIAATPDGRIVAPGSAGPVIVDPATGATEPAGTTQTVCFKEIMAPIAYRELTIDGEMFNSYNTGKTIGVCDVTGQPVDVTQPFPDGLASEVAGLQILTTTVGVQAFRVN